ncbi:MAG: glycoside hydrolase family 3 protein [Clostridiales bacterium]|nr:glycoside hydrolase family 3 protein [Clostridiales bacterium]
MKKTIALLLGLSMLMPLAACSPNAEPAVTSETSGEVTPGTTSTQESNAETGYKYQKYASMTPEEIVADLTIEQKASQMVMPLLENVSSEEMAAHSYGSIYADDDIKTSSQWRRMVDSPQQAAIEMGDGIPYLIAQDDVHGVGYCINAVYFPHNIGVGAANDPDLAYQMGKITADEALICHMRWNLYPCVAQSNDPRWGRNYECYSSDLEIIKNMSSAYTKGLIDGGAVACAKHFFGDGNVLYGTGEKSDYDRIIDRGDSRLTQDQIDDLIKVYKEQIDAGVQTIMVSYSALNGKKMHENKEYIMKLKDEMGFEGFIVSDSMAIRNTSLPTYEEQVISAVNCGIDALMEGERYDEARQIIIDAAGAGKISEDRINDAVTRIIKVKKDAGVFDDPFCENLTTVQENVGSLEYRKVAEQLVQKSLVLLKNDKNTLPIKPGTKIYITGPAADDGAAQCGGWTLAWDGSPTSDMDGVVTIKKAFEKYAQDYGIEIITDPAGAKDADAVILCVGEKAYSEWFGDTEDMELCGKMGLEGNRDAINEAARLGKPTVACIIAGRQVILDQNDMANWDSVVMCYLPGSEGKGITDVLCGCNDFTGRLPEPWYGSVNQIRTDKHVWDIGYGLSYGAGFTPRTEPQTVVEVPDTVDDNNAEATDPMAGTNYTRGVVENYVYSNEYAKIDLAISPDLMQMSDEEIAENNAGAQGDLNDKDGLRQAATVTDASFMSDWREHGDTDYVDISFVNTTLGMPDVPDCSENDYLDAEQDFMMRTLEKQGFKAEFKDRTTVTLGGNDYVRATYDLDLGEMGSGIQTVHTYVRKIDNDLMIVITVSGILPVADYDAMFK